MANVQLYAYEIDTHNQDKINSMLAKRGAVPFMMKELEYLQLQILLQRDQIVKYALKTMSDDTLTVFVAPEFFFKEADGTPYSHSGLMNAIEYCKELSGKSFPSVVWCPGTIWWSEPILGTNQVRVHNTALVFQNGQLKCSWQKNRVSDIDGLKVGPETWDRWDPGSEKILDDPLQTPFFHVACADGQIVECGLEVCLDHLTLSDEKRGVMRTRYLREHPDPDEGSGVDLHILIAAGMGVQPENIVARNGGAFFRCDGGSAAAPRSESIVIKRDGLSNPAALRNWAPKCLRAKAVHIEFDFENPDKLDIVEDPGNRLAIYPVIRLS